MERVSGAVEEAAKAGDFGALYDWLNTVRDDVNRYFINEACFLNLC